MDDLTWRAHQQLVALQQQGIEQVRAHQQWAQDLWQQQANLFSQPPMAFMPPAPAPCPLQTVVYNPPVVLHTSSFVQRKEYRQQQQQQQQVLYNSGFAYPFIN